MSFIFGKDKNRESPLGATLTIQRPFANAVKAGVGAIMSSYNQIKNSYSSQNSYTLNHLLKDELGYQVSIGSCCTRHEGSLLIMR